MTSPKKLCSPNFAQIWIKYSSEAMQSLKFIAYRVLGDIAENLKGRGIFMPPLAPRGLIRPLIMVVGEKEHLVSHLFIFFFVG